ncbi:MAG TPA: zf-HC2 domain-containing protein [Burkholderiales bacterium]|nr:zf-HC2 domain-containing protein [Burkholderiales bacterium]
MNLSCKEASRLMSQAEDRKLSQGERVMLTAHLAVCRACRAAADQFQHLRRALRRLFDEPR